MPQFRLEVIMDPKLLPEMGEYLKRITPKMPEDSTFSGVALECDQHPLDIIKQLKAVEGVLDIRASCNQCGILVTSGHRCGTCGFDV